MINQHSAHCILFSVTSISDGMWKSAKITVPDGVTSLRAVGLVMSDNLGLGFTPVPQKVTRYSLCFFICQQYFYFWMTYSLNFQFFSFAKRMWCLSLFAKKKKLREFLFASSFHPFPFYCHSEKLTSFISFLFFFSSFTADCV